VLFAVEKSKVEQQAAQETPSIQKICDSTKCLFAAVGKFNLLLNYFYLVPVREP